MNIALIFAGGTGCRMHSNGTPKQFILMHGKPIIIHTIEKFEYNKNIDAIVIVCIENWIPYLHNLLKKYNITKVVQVVKGGSNGQESIYCGLVAAKSIAKSKDDIVLIHDGVRPMISDQVIDDNIISVKKYGSAITSIPVTETVILVGEGKSIRSIPSRTKTRLARAPQSFYLDNIFASHTKAMSEGIHDFIDSCSMMQHYGYKLNWIDGPEENIKITTPKDLYIMRAFIDMQEDFQLFEINTEKGNK